jgi:hypothetical protein
MRIHRPARIDAGLLECGDFSPRADLEVPIAVCDNPDDGRVHKRADIVVKSDERERRLKFTVANSRLIRIENDEWRTVFRDESAEVANASGSVATGSFNKRGL